MTTIPMQKLRSRSGFTLIELMVVLVVLAVLAAIILPKFFGRTDDAKITAAKVQMRALEDALQYFEVDNGYYPTTEQGLDALVSKPTAGRVPEKWREGGYLQKSAVPKDPWGNPFVYLSPGSHGPFDIVSHGADGLPGGEGNNADINSWEVH
jgi:general secretion pathway protein G